MGKISLSGVTTPEQPEPLASDFVPSPQQRDIFGFVRESHENLIIEARAGTGKTTTLVELCKQLRSGIVFLAFNKSIATEIGRKLAEAGLSWKDAKAATMHSIGFSAWKKHAPKTANNVRGEKLDLIMERLGTPNQYRSFCKKLVSLAKQQLFGVYTGPNSIPLDDDQAWIDLIEHYDLMQDVPMGEDDVDEETYIEYALAWSLKILKESIDTSLDMVDFDDMIYMPLYANLRFWQYDWVLIDEAQDTNMARRILAAKLLRPHGGRLIAVGDRHQAIYGFTGASAQALDHIAHDFQCVTLPLTVTYRCPRSVVRMAQQWVPDIEARHDAPEGVVTEMEHEKFLQLIPEPTDAILCRNTKPLVQLAFGYLRRHIPCYIEGKAIGAQLIALCRKWKTPQNIGEFVVKLEEYVEHEREKLLSQHKEAQFEAIADKVDTLLVLADSLGHDQPIQDIIDLLNRMFKDGEGLQKQVLTLSTIHKAKGREWPRVFFLGRKQLIPSSYARLEWQLEQEFNLAYVGVTRAMEQLIEVPLPPR